MKVEKAYTYIPEMLKKALCLRVSETGNVKDPVSVSERHPCNIAATIAPVPPLPTPELVRKHRSRIGMYITVVAAEATELRYAAIVEESN